MINDRAFNQTVRLLSLTARATTLIDNVPESYQEIVQERDEVADQFDQELLEIDNPELYAAMVDLRSAFVEDLTVKARTRPQLEEVLVRGVGNVLTLANQLYGDATRADEIASRNNLSAPGLLENKTLLVLST